MTYGRSGDALYAEIRREAFGEDIGQFSWLTAHEYRRFFRVLGLGPESHVLEIACGSGGPMLFMVEETGCRATGVDVHEVGIDAARARASELGLDGQASFVHADARERLPFENESFDALTCIDAMNHLYERERILADWYRVLRSGGRILFTDPITVTGMLRREEIAARSGSMGEFVFTAAGLDERLALDAGFVDVRVEDVSQDASDVAARWRAARARHASELDRIEGAGENAAFQHFLEVVATLAGERRLSRFVIVATKP